MNAKKKSALKHYAGLAGIGVGGVTTIQKLRKAMADKDRLAVLNAVLRIASIATAAAILIRSIRRGDDAEVEA